MIKFNYILNDLALISLITKCLYSENVNYSDKEELENQIKLIQQENKQLKMIIKEYERLNKVNNRGFKITNIKEYNIDELLSYKKYKDNWNKLKEWASNFYNSEEVGWAGCGMRYTLEKIQELEQGGEINGFR